MISTIQNTIRNTIQNTIRNTLGDDAFNMLNLFSGGQRGVWYDPSDLATMYQESTGVTAVTADGQPVGLMLDKSRGDALGDELIQEGYTPKNLNISLYSLSNVQDGSFGQGALYEISITIVDYIGGDLRFQFYDTGSNSLIYSKQLAPSNGLFNFRFFSIDSFDRIRFQAAGSGFAGTVDNISVKEVLGTTASQPVATKRPTYKDTPDRLEIDLVDDALLFDVPTGGIDGYMVVGTDEGTASYGVSLPAGDYDIGGDYFMGGSVNGFLLREGDVSASDLSNVEKDFVSKGAKASYGDVTDFTSYWRDKGITEFPLIDTSSGISFQAAWYINKLTSFPLIDTSNVTNFRAAWFGNKLTSFPLIDMSSGTDIRYAWNNNPNLTDFPANMFDNCLATEFDFAFSGTNLSQSSIDGILVSINSNGTSSGRFNQSGGSAPSATGEAAIDALRSRGWTITVTGGY